MNRPNILQITCHDLGRHLGCYGIESVHTPTLDRLAAEGVRFASSFCTSPGCSPSRAAMATGRYSHSNGVMGLAHAHFGWELGPGERHIAGLLAEGGYHTVLFGLQHVTYHPEKLGFREIFKDRPADGVAENIEQWVSAIGVRSSVSGVGKGSTQDRTPNTEDRTRFYAEVNFFEPHRPFDFGGVASDREKGVQVPPWLADNAASREELAGLQGAIRKMDAAAERILAAVERAGLADGTLVVFTADHGIAFPRAKTTLHDAGIEVALLARWPAGGVAGGAVHEELVSTVDLLPTLLEAAGASAPGNIQGQSFLPLLQGRPYQPRTAVFAEKTYHELYDPQRCVRTARHKLIHHFEVASRAYASTDITNGPTYKTMANDLATERSMLELYDLETDPTEQRNLANDASHAGTVADLGRQLRAWMQETEDPLLHGPIASPFYHEAIRTLNGW
jgi:arylsulfatase A-like enzyme